PDYSGLDSVLEKKRPRTRANVRSAPAEPCGSGPVRVITLKCRVALTPLTSTTLSVRSSSSFEIAQRETNPIPLQTSTADLIASVESRITTFLKALSG